MKSVASQRDITSFSYSLLLIYWVVQIGGSIPGIDISMPPSHIALSGDLHIQITSSSFPPLLLQLLRLEGNTAQVLTTFSILPEAKALMLNTTVVKIGCGYFARGGLYYVLFKKQHTGLVGNLTQEQKRSSIITRTLDVRWPMPQLSLTPEHVQTYPEGPVIAILEFMEVVCPPILDNLANAIPEFWVELHYCGHSLLTCDNNGAFGNQSNPQVLYSEQVRGLPGRRMLKLRCELFGLAGHYALFLRPTTSTPLLPHTAAYVKADWSDQFVFNVHARSIFPCDVHSGGITVLFQYPSCILSTGDRVRLFARLRANVASLAPPTTLEYVAEQRVIRGQHSLHFDCDLFTERYVEYCFVYVSQAITGAVADVRMDCVPTLPVTELESGGWGKWTSWTSCSTTCIGGIRSRYRLCDSPPPRYGAKFCEGTAVETEKCGISIGNSWECFYGHSVTINDIASEIPEVQAEVGPYCRCGCVVHLGKAKPQRILATSSQSCPGRTFWQIQADEDHIIQFKVEQFHLPCGRQWLKIRDGSSLSMNLLAALSDEPNTTPCEVNSTGNNLLLEFYSDEIFGSADSCGGGFLAYATQIRADDQNVVRIPLTQNQGDMPTFFLKLTEVHIVAIFFLSGLLVATSLLGAQYVFRYRKYHIAQADDQDSLTDQTASCGSITGKTRAPSTTTLLSEVISLTKLKPHVRLARNKHNRLRESVYSEQGDDEQEVTLAQEESLSIGSTTTLTNEERTTTATQITTSDPEEISCSAPNSPLCYDTRSMQRSSTSTNDKDMFSEKRQGPTQSSPLILRRASNASTVTLTNVRPSLTPLSKSDPGCYVPAQSSISRATIKSTNAKETKDKKNREKLLAGPSGSDFSIMGAGIDLEIDYYDYNVVNAGAAPGSYLGMDPAFLVWIPPLDESGEILPECEKGIHETEDIRPKIYIDPGSNKESPEEEMLLPKPERTIAKITPRYSPLPKAKFRNTQLLEEKGAQNYEREPLVGNKKIVNIQLHEFPGNFKRFPASGGSEYVEKETEVRKSPGLDSNILNEIKFADEDDDKDMTDNECNIEKPYHLSNILSSN